MKRFQACEHELACIIALISRQTVEQSNEKVGNKHGYQIENGKENIYTPTAHQHTFIHLFFLFLFFGFCSLLLCSHHLMVVVAFCEKKKLSFSLTLYAFQADSERYLAYVVYFSVHSLPYLSVLWFACFLLSTQFSYSVLCAQLFGEMMTEVFLLAHNFFFSLFIPLCFRCNFHCKTIKQVSQLKKYIYILDHFKSNGKKNG